MDKILYIHQTGGGMRHCLINTDDGTEFNCRRVVTTILFDLDA